MPLNDVPLSGQSLAVTRNPINQNFAVIATAFEVDHVDYNDPLQGKHGKVSFINLPGATFLAGEMGLFNQNAAPTNRPDIWMARGTAAAFPITGYHNVAAGATNGWTYLPSGLKIIWGTATIPTPGSITITYATADATFPGFTTFWTCPQLTRIKAGAVAPVNNFVAVNIYGQVSFVAQSSGIPVTAGGTVPFAWMAIGK